MFSQVHLHAYFPGTPWMLKHISIPASPPLKLALAITGASMTFVMTASLFHLVGHGTAKFQRPCNSFFDSQRKKAVISSSHGNHSGACSSTSSVWRDNLIS